MRSLFFDYDGDLRFWVILTLMFAVCIFVPTAAIYYTERYECKTVYAEGSKRVQRVIKKGDKIPLYAIDTDHDEE